MVRLKQILGPIAGLVCVLATVQGAKPAPAAQISGASVLGWSPGATVGVPPAAPISLYFNRPMDMASVTRAWRLVPSAPGAFHTSATSLTFVPAHPLRATTKYQLSVGSLARSTRGIPLTPFSLAFSTTEALRIASYSPAGGTQAVPATGRLSITFNHPMVPLSGVNAETRNPAGWSLHIQPVLPGYGSWLGTSTWVFHPRSGLRPSTRYTVTLAGSARDSWGQPLGHPLQWSFRTVAPELFSRSPRNGARYVDPRAPVRVVFNQSMDHVSTARAFALTQHGVQTPGTVNWNGATLIFHPESALIGGRTYRVSIARSARSVNGQASLRKAVYWSFHVAPAPALTGLAPGRNKTDWASPSWGYLRGPRCCYSYSATLYFNTPMSKASLDHHLHVSPTVGQFDTSFGGPDQSGQFAYTIWGAFSPSSSHIVTLDAGIQDAFGRPFEGSITYPFKTSETFPSVALYGMPNGNTVAFSAGQIKRAPLQTVNVPTVHFTLIRTNLYNLNQNGCYGCQPSGTVVRRWTQTTPQATNQVQNPGVELKTKTGAALPPGLYWLGAEGPDSVPGWKAPSTSYYNWPPQSSEVVIVNNVSITAKSGANGTLAWANSTQTGKPMKGAHIRLTNWNGSALISATTASNGTHMFHGFNGNGPKPVYAAVVNDGTHFGIAELGWQADISSPTFFNWHPWLPYGAQNAGGAYAYTDRPVYRPGQTVHFRAVLWHNSDGVYSLQHPGPLTVTVHNAVGKQFYHANVRLDRFGAVSGSFKLPSGMPTGDSYLWVGGSRVGSASTPFTVAEYRKPEFLATITSGATRYAQGQTAPFSVAVRYVFGAPVVRQQVQWTAYAEPQVQQPPGWDAYTFVDWESLWSQWSTWDPYSYSSQGNLGKPIARGTGRTDAAGKLSINLPINMKGQLMERNVTVEVTASDANHQSISARAQIGEYHSNLAIGLRADSETVQAGKPESIAIVAVHQDGTPAPNSQLTATISKRTYTSKLVTDTNHMTSWQPVPHDTPVHTEGVTTDAGGKSALTFTPATGGEYRVQLSGKDASGNPASTALSIYASDNGQTDWGASQNTSITLKPDHQTYSVGQTAHILVPAPFADAAALVSVDRGTIRSYWVTHLTGNSGVVDVPIHLDAVPNEYVTVTLYHGWRGSTPPAWRSGTTELHIRLDPRRVQVHLAQSGGTHHPGDQVAYTVTTTDMSGKPVSAQVSLALVDTAVLALKDQTNADILQAFYAELPLGVSTASEGTLSIDNLTTTVDTPIQPSGGVNGAVKARPEPAVPPTGGGGGGPPQGGAAYFGPAHGASRSSVPGVTLRSHFSDTAYWRGNVVTNSSGHATVHVRLPDNTTTWRLDARSLTTHQDVGQATLQTLATRDLVLRPVLPRFFVQGDHLKIGVALNNRLNRPVAAAVTVGATGLHLPSRATTVRVGAKGERLLLWPATVPVGSNVVLTARAVPQTPGMQGDAVQVAVPVHPPLTDETTATSGQVYSTVRQVVLVPRNAVSVPGSLTVEVRSSITAGLGAAYGQFHPTAHESNDDVANRVLVAASLHSLPQAITGVSAKTYARLPIDIAVGVQKLLDKQFYDGGWPWFTDAYTQRSDPLITADVVQAIAASGRSGPLIQSALSRARLYLWNQTGSGPAALRTHLLAILALSGGGLGSRPAALYNDSIRRLHLDAGPLADLGTALQRTDDRTHVHSVVASLQGSAKVSATGAHWEASDASYFAGPPIYNTAEVLSTLVRLSPNDPLEPAAARWLVLARQGDGWDDNRSTARVIAALAAYARAVREGNADYRYHVVLGGKQRLAGTYAPAHQRAVPTIHVPVASLNRSGPTMLDIGRSRSDGSFGTGPLYFLARLRYFLHADSIPARSEGVSVTRRFLTLAGHPITSVTAGSPVKVQLTVHTDQTLIYLDIEDPIPAGCEPIDETLNTSQQGIGQRPVWYPASSSGAVADLAPYLIHTDLRDNHVSLYAYYLSPGTFRYTYLMQATVAGTYGVPPTHVSEQFFPEVFGRSAGSSFVVR